MIHIHKPSWTTRAKRRLRRIWVIGWAGPFAWYRTIKHIHSLPETHERELVDEKAPG